MRSIILLLLLCSISYGYGQDKELIVTVKSIDIDDAEGGQSPFINYVDDNGTEQWFSFTLPIVGMDEYAVIMIGDDLLIKVASTYQAGDNTIIDGYEFNQDVAKSLIGKKIKIIYSPIDLTAYLYSIEVIG